MSVELSFPLLSVVTSCPDPAGREILPILPLGQQLAVPTTTGSASGSPGRTQYPVWIPS